MSKKQFDRAVWIVARVGYDPMPRNPERPEEWILNDEVMACCQRDRQRLGPEEDAELTEQNRLRTEQVKNRTGQEIASSTTMFRCIKNKRVFVSM